MLGSSPGHGAQLDTSLAPSPMGLSADADGGLTLASGASIIRYRNVLRADERINAAFDACFIPRTLHMTGPLDVHDVGLDGDGRIIFVSTRFNCLATVSEAHSFEALWRPPFISALVDEDRCHLNGLAMQDGRPAYVTAAGRSDVRHGWRDRRKDGGVVIDVRSGQVICEGLSMPHSPRLHRGELWLLNAGTGELGVVERPGAGMGRFQPRVFCPGFTRGLAFHRGLAFVGLSKPRGDDVRGLALTERMEASGAEPWCGVQVIDLERRCCVDWLRLEGSVSELYGLAVISGRTCPMAASPGSADALGLITVAATSNGRTQPGALGPVRSPSPDAVPYSTVA